MAPKSGGPRANSRDAKAKAKPKAKAPAARQGNVRVPAAKSTMVQASSVTNETAKDVASAADTSPLAMTQESPVEASSVTNDTAKDVVSAADTSPLAMTQESPVEAELVSGDVVVRYSMYDEKFPMDKGKMTAATIDEVYCLSDVMPGCQIHLSLKSPEEKYAMDAAGETFPYLFEDPPGTFHGLEVGKEYFAFVTEDEAEFLRSQERTRQTFSNALPRAAEREDRCDAYTAAFRQVFDDAKLEGQRKGLDGESLSAFVQHKVEQFNANQ